MARDYEMKREYLQDGEKIEFEFEQNEFDFIVEEIPCREFKGSGNYLICYVEKKNMTTWDMIATFAKFLNINAEKIGYAGLKDKHATTYQYISVEAKYENALKKFKHKQIKILKRVRDKFSIRMGDLAGNRFKINLFGVEQKDAGKIEKLAYKTAKLGLPNYFGYQRFGRDGDSLQQAKEMIEGELHIEDTKVKKFLISVYQSQFFNDWLKERVLESRANNGGQFRLLSGDIFVTPEGKIFTPKKIPQKDFQEQKVVPTGLLCGRGVYRARGEARKIQEKYDDGFLYEKGSRREAIVFPKDIVCKYDKNFGKFTLAFTLPKGSYATVFLENVANRNLKAKKIKKKSKKL